MPVHPHACGENGLRHPTGGSSFRYTPTPVGKTLLLRRLLLIQTVHPHACGENLIFSPPRWNYSRYTPTPVGKTFSKFTSGSPIAGTPPRLWGKPSKFVYTLAEMRYTPTPVGKTAMGTGTYSRKTVHPHACGENTIEDTRNSDSNGTPPRLWGKRAGLELRDTPSAGTPPRLWGKLSSCCPSS